MAAIHADVEQFQELTMNPEKESAQLIVDAYQTHGLPESIRLLYGVVKDRMPILGMECAAKPSHAVWMLRMVSCPGGSAASPRLNVYGAMLVASRTKKRIESAEGNAVILSRDEEPQFFAVLAPELENSICLCLLNNERNMVYLYLYARKGCCFAPRHAEELTRLTAPLRKELADSFLFPYLFDLTRITGNNVSLLSLCPDLAPIRKLARQIAPMESLVLLTGESGVGKDVVAKAIHEQSSRRDGPFVKVNCGAIPENLLDSELFGYEKGAFTGAEHPREGYFARADGGTIFLDEIGELSPAAQVRLLHVLESGLIQRVGATEHHKVNVRIIAATNRDLWTAAEKGQFREDLCYRLFVCHMHIPPLRERPNDIPVLIWYFLNRKSVQMNIPPKLQLKEQEIGELCIYDWPGNVRELEHTIERALVYSGDSPALNIRIHTYKKRRYIQPEPSGAWPTLDEYMAVYLRRVLEHTKGVLKGPNGAARLLGVNPGTLRSRLIKYGLLETGGGRGRRGELRLSAEENGEKSRSARPREHF